MAKPVVENLLGGPIAYPGPYDVISTIEYGAIQSATSTRIVIEYGAARLVLKGSFEVDGGGQVLSGTVAGFGYLYGTTKIVKGSGFALSYADLAAAGFDEVGAMLFGSVVQKGSAGDDYMYGVTGNGALLGRGGDDWLWGSNGNETLKGGDGNDFLVGNGGSNKLWGGAGKDVFAFGFNLSGNDKVKDFQPGKDKIGLDYNYFAPLGSGYLSKKEFVVGKNANADRAQVIYDKKTGMLYYDEDGLGVAPKIAICELAPKLDLKASHIFVGFWD